MVNRTAAVWNPCIRIFMKVEDIEFELVLVEGFGYPGGAYERSLDEDLPLLSLLLYGGGLSSTRAGECEGPDLDTRIRARRESKPTAGRAGWWVFCFSGPSQD